MAGNTHLRYGAVMLIQIGKWKGSLYADAGSFITWSMVCYNNNNWPNIVVYGEGLNIVFFLFCYSFLKKCFVINKICLNQPNICEMILYIYSIHLHHATLITRKYLNEVMSTSLST